ncbi:hypothetical protein ACFL0Q_06390 [Thermodesulfobacteriota bacterium]
MMRRSRSFPRSRAWLCVLVAGLLYGATGRPALLYKNYELRRVDGVGILCDAYTVQEGDHVYRLLRLRGQIADEDLPHFFALFKKLNPDVENPDVIHPGQRILIPLKRLGQAGTRHPESFTVTIPFVTIPVQRSDKPLEWAVHTVTSGQCVSKLLESRSVNSEALTYREALGEFKRLNLSVTDLNRIRVGQVLRLPVGRSSPPDIAARKDKQIAPPAPAPRPRTMPARAPSRKQPRTLEWAIPIFSGAGASLFHDGAYHFPRQEGQDLRLDLSNYPVLRLPDNSNVIMCLAEELPESTLKVVRAFWGPTNVVTIPGGTSPREAADSLFPVLGRQWSVDRIAFSDQGMRVRVRGHQVLEGQQEGPKMALTWISSESEKTSDSIRRYLRAKGVTVLDLLPDGTPAGQEGDQDERSSPPVKRIDIPLGSGTQFVAALAGVLGLHYAENVQVSFPCGGFQVQTVSNILKTEDGRNFLVDFETLQGQAPEILEDMGLKVVTIAPKQDYRSIARAIASALGIDCETDPVFYGADRPWELNTSVAVPGLLLTDSRARRFLLTEAVPHRDLARFFGEQGLMIVVLRKGSFASS